MLPKIASRDDALFVVAEKLDRLATLIKTDNDARENMLGRAWRWEVEHGGGEGWPSLGSNEVVASAFADTQGFVESLFALVNDAAPRGELLDEGKQKVVERILNGDLTLLGEIFLRAAAVRLIQEISRNLWHFAVWRSGNPWYDIVQLRHPASRASFFRALENLTAGIFRKPISPQRWNARQRDLRAGISQAARMLGATPEHALKTIAAGLLPQIAGQITAESPDELIQGVARALDAEIPLELADQRMRSERPAIVLSLDDPEAQRDSRMVRQSGPSLGPDSGRKLLAVATEFARSKPEHQTVVLSACFHGGLAGSARALGETGNWARQRLSIFRKRVKSRLDTLGRQTLVQARVFYVSGPAREDVCRVLHGPVWNELTRTGVGVLGSSGCGRRYVAVSFPSPGIEYRLADSDALTVFMEQVQGRSPVAANPLLPRYCSACGGALNRRNGPLCPVVKLSPADRECPYCGQPKCSHASWCKHATHWHHFEAVRPGGELRCSCGAQLAETDIHSVSRTRGRH